MIKAWVLPVGSLWPVEEPPAASSFLWFLCVFISERRSGEENQRTNAMVPYGAISMRVVPGTYTPILFAVNKAPWWRRWRRRWWRSWQQLRWRLAGLLLLRLLELLRGRAPTQRCVLLPWSVRWLLIQCCLLLMILLWFRPWLFLLWMLNGLLLLWMLNWLLLPELLF